MLGGYLLGPLELLEDVFAVPNEQNPARENTNEEGKSTSTSLDAQDAQQHKVMKNNI